MAARTDCAGIQFFDPNRARTQGVARDSYSYASPRDSKERETPSR